MLFGVKVYRKTREKMEVNYRTWVRETFKDCMVFSWLASRELMILITCLM